MSDPDLQVGATKRRPGPVAPLSSTPVGGRRAARIRYTLIHAGTVALALGLVALLAVTIQRTLANQGIGFSFAYLSRPSDFNISEGLAPVWSGGLPKFESVSAESSNLAMLSAGLFNSIKVALLAILLSTVIGIAFGVSRLSTNWLVRKLAFAIVEFIRNTPLLIQIVFWYFGVMMRLPPVTGAANAYAWLVAGQSGVFLPLPRLSDQAGPVSVGLLILTVIMLAAACVRRVGARRRLVFAGVGLFVGGACWVMGFPLGFSLPTLGRFGATGGLELTPEMAAILLAITINSAAYVAEIVRGAIESLPKGQWEAAAALGLSRRDTLRDVVLPQVFRIILPSLGNRYISLTKDTSLGIAIGFPDLFNVSGTVANQTGRNLETVLIVMLTYLLLSWVISATVNAANRRIVLSGAQ
jgi:general L-amino acid transport system permease protein